MKLCINNLQFQTIIGILEHERITPQTVLLHVKIWYTYDESSFINYVDICTFIETRMQEAAYLLIEDALKDLSEKIMNRYLNAYKIKIKIFKPDILPNAIVGVSHTLKRSKN